MAQIILDSNNNLIQGDFDNATLNNRTKLQTTTTNATTNVYVVPNGSSTSAGVSVANNSSLTNASKIVMATNGSTDTQIISGVNGSGTYLPMSFYVNNTLALQISTSGVVSAPYGGFSGAGPVLKYVTDTTDIAVTADAPTHTLVGSSFSVSIPTSGVIRIASFSGRVVKGAGTTNISQTWGIRIGSTNYWFSLANNNGTLGYAPATISSSATNGNYDQFYGTFNIYPYNYMWQNIIDITAQSVPTGTQTVQLIAAKAAYAGNPWTDPWTLKGTTTTTRVGLEFVSAS